MDEGVNCTLTNRFTGSTDHYFRFAKGGGGCTARAHGQMEAAVFKVSLGNILLDDSPTAVYCLCSTCRLASVGFFSCAWKTYFACFGMAGTAYGCLFFSSGTSLHRSQHTVAPQAPRPPEREGQRARRRTTILFWLGSVGRGFRRGGGRGGSLMRGVWTGQEASMRPGPKYASRRAPLEWASEEALFCSPSRVTLFYFCKNEVCLGGGYSTLAIVLVGCPLYIGVAVAGWYQRLCCNSRD